MISWNEYKEPDCDLGSATAFPSIPEQSFSYVK